MAPWLGQWRESAHALLLSSAATCTMVGATDDHQCVVHVSGNVRVLGGDLPNMPVKHDSWDDCCNRCWTDEKYKDICVRICYSPDTKDCWLHTEEGGHLVNDDHYTLCGPPTNESPYSDCKHYPKLGEECSRDRPCCGPGDVLTCEYKDGLDKPAHCESQDKIKKSFRMGDSWGAVGWVAQIYPHCTHPPFFATRRLQFACTAKQATDIGLAALLLRCVCCGA